ncbi:hypothetical protein AB4Z09_28790 [Rhodococcus sp. TAF43]|uniref:hypothetical protein n=1 Tax=unclassified Rhodococcus (in: high G+C Gram-positive bacteria) TaxID=192944 RepID=UPI0011C02893|nr:MULTISPECIES: hypothetical protein [unclassified Rhodococcus (in: high G+C Gram-positive bacteria)]QKT11915.1 hypothetical protein HUN07_15390 [Rhodococcus sp. W8901]
MIAAALIPAAAAGLMVTAAGTASAAYLRSGEGYQGISFDHNETRILRDLGVGNAIDVVVPLEWIGMAVGEGSIYDSPLPYVDATAQQLIDEAVARGGYIQFDVSDPAIWGSRFDVIQQW